MAWVFTDALSRACWRLYLDSMAGFMVPLHITYWYCIMLQLCLSLILTYIDTRLFISVLGEDFIGLVKAEICELCQTIVHIISKYLTAVLESVNIYIYKRKKRSRNESPFHQTKLLQWVSNVFVNVKASYTTVHYVLTPSYFLVTN